MSDNNENRKTVADLAAAMRDLAVLAEKCMASIRPSVVMDFADCIEAAWKRERDRLASEPRSWEEVRGAGDDSKGGTR